LKTPVLKVNTLDFQVILLLFFMKKTARWVKLISQIQSKGRATQNNPEIKYCFDSLHFTWQVIK